MLSDISLDQNGTVLPPATDPEAVIAGSEGQVLLVNGKVYPTLAAQSGRRQRWRIVNASRAPLFSARARSQCGRRRSPIELTVDQLADKVVMGINGVPASEAEPLHALVGSTRGAGG